MGLRTTLLAAILFMTGAVSYADVELPKGMTGCPFIHDDKYDVAPVIETLKAQIATELDNRQSCKQEIQTIVTNLTPLQDFYQTIDPTIKQKIAKDVYASALTSLASRKIELEVAGNTHGAEYSTIISQISMIESSRISNEIDLLSNKKIQNQYTEAYYRNQLLAHTSNLINALSSTARNRPECFGKMGGASTVLSTILSGASVGLGLGVNPMAQAIGAATQFGAQLITMLQDVKIRSAYNDLIRIKNNKTLACTYYSIKKASCEYQRAYRIAQNPSQLKQFLKNQFDDSKRGEYDRYFVNYGRMENLGELFAVISQMGSPLTLDLATLSNYLGAKAVDFTRLGDAPPDGSPDDVVKEWLTRARILGITFSERDPFTGATLDLKTQLKSAKADIQVKLASIDAAEKLIRKNPSFLDLRRRLSSDFPNVRKYVVEMRSYFESMKKVMFVADVDKGTINAAITLLKKLDDFLAVALKNEDDKSVTEYEDEVVSKGGAIFEELAKGSIAQLTRQSVVALAGKGVDRLSWTFGMIRNTYLNRDQTQNLPKNERFSEYQKNYSVLADVIENYSAFYGVGASYRNEEIATTIKSFEKSFNKDMMKSLSMAMDEELGWKDLRGKTAAHLCALYAPTLENMSRRGLIENKSARLLDACRARYSKLETNHLIVDEDFKINYEDECTYFEYIRETDIQNLLVTLD